MLFSLKNAASGFPRIDLAFSGCNALVAVAFYIAMLCEPKQVPGDTLVAVLIVSAVLGLVMGLYFKFRSRLSSLHAMIGSGYLVIAMEISFGGSVVALALLIAGRPDLRWFGFNTNLACMALSLLAGVLLEAGKLGLLKGENRWREEIGKYLDYPKRLVYPTLTTKRSTMSTSDAIWIGGALAVNIPLLFQIYSGSRDNAIFLVAPLMTLTFSYVNLKSFGPGLTRIFLLRKIEKEQDYRFQHAEYEKVQELRRTFFLSRWLMKDYRPPIDAKLDKQTMNKQKQRHKG